MYGMHIKKTMETAKLDYNFEFYIIISNTIIRV